MGEKRKILYVDDEEINVKLFEISLRQMFHVITASSASAGLKALEEEPAINVVITDLKMPEIDGLEFIKRIKQKNRGIVCLLLTGYIEADVMLEGFNKELIFRYMTKPWKKDYLISNIEEAFNNLSEANRN